jgi:predicted transcriptional regulator YdeE/2-polyprenyl-3-methyl-5-hydroxy-6-metoxy-1,4-benzoquinol methylase
VIPAPDIVKFSGKILAGLSSEVTFSDGRTGDLWRQLMPIRKTLSPKNADLYSVEVFPDGFFESFEISRPFRKWAAIELETPALPEGWATLRIPDGLYAVFLYRGLASDAAPFYNEIFTSWLPASGYAVDARPHFALMDARYKRDSADSEETIWIPVRPKPRDENRRAVRLFNAVADDYDAKFSPLTIYDSGYGVFLNTIPPNGKILDIACGPGNLSHYFLSKRADLDVFGIDLAPKMIDLARRNNPNARFAVMDARRISDIGERFDGICCGFALPYLSDTEIRSLFSDAFQLLNPGGTAYFSTIEGPDSVRIDTSGDRRHTLTVHTHSASTITKWLAQAGFAVSALDRVGYASSRGEETHLAAIAMKP